MQTIFQQHVQVNFPFLKRARLLLAISGGMDSMTLFYLIKNLNPNIALAHCNFKLRGKDADADEKFVISIAKKNNIPVFTTSFETEKYAKAKSISIQMAARELRYQWFSTLAEQHHFDYVLTAHHADDNLETFLINLTRGTGLEGLTGIPSQNGKIIRPLLSFSRKEITDFAKEHQLDWREDQSNAETKYLRNKIRHDIIPLLKSLNPNFKNAFQQTLSNLQGSRDLIQNHLLTTLPKLSEKEGNVLKINIKKLQQLKNTKTYLYHLLNPYQFTDWDEIYHLLEAQSGKQIFSKTHKLLNNRGYLWLAKIEDDKEREERIAIEKGDTSFSIGNLFVKISFERKENISSHINSAHCISIDKNKLQFPLIVRKWKNGDYFYPLGLQGKKKLSKFLKDEKISLIDKENIYLLCSQQDVVWVIGKRLDDRFKISDTTNEIVKFEMQT